MTFGVGLSIYITVADVHNFCPKNTPPPLPPQAHSLARVGDAPSEDSISITWTLALPSPSPAVHVGYRKLEGDGVGVVVANDDTSWQWEPVTARDEANATAVHTLKNLVPGSVYEVVVRSSIGGGGGTMLLSDPFRVRTSAAGATHTTAFRISEYTFEVDFLQNHDAASPLAMPVYIQNNGGMNETSIEHYNGGNWSMDECLAALDEACPTQRGTSFACMRCADAARPQLEKYG